MIDINERKYKVPEVAVIFDKSTKAIWNAIQNGDLAVYRIGRSVRVGESEVRRVLTEGFQPARRRATETAA